MAEITGTPIADLLFGSLGNDEIAAQVGDDNALGFDGDDVIFGNAGNDVLGGNQGNDTTYGGRGNDILLNGQGDDLGSGDEGIDLIFGNKGSDALFGNAGDDAMFGGMDSDFLFGGQGNDFLAGELGNDVISGDRGADTLSGGAGNDLFVLTKGGGGSTPEDADLILDFQVGDRIALTGGLRLPEISIQFVPNSNNNGRGDVIVRDLGDSTGTFLAIFRNVEEGAITRDTLTTSLTPLEGDNSGGGGGGSGGGGGDGGDGGDGTTQNVPPFARDGNLNTTEDNFVTGFFEATDANNDRLTFSILNDPTLGRVTISDPQSGFFVYTPNPNASGQDTLTFVANDGTFDSNEATITIDIFPVEDVPVASSATVTTPLNTIVPVVLSGFDGDGDPITRRITSLPTNGQLFQTEDGMTPSTPITQENTVVTNAEGIVIFVPDGGQTEATAFGFIVSDGKADSAAATVTVNIGETSSNALPMLDLNGIDDGVDLVTLFLPGQPVAISSDLTVTDSDSLNLTSATVRIANIQDVGFETLGVTIPDGVGIVQSSSEAGTLTLTGSAPLATYEEVLRSVTYDNASPTPNRSQRSIVFTVNDGIDNSAPVVSSVNYLPEAIDETVVITNNTRRTLSADAFLANDLGTGLSITEVRDNPPEIIPNGTNPISSIRFNSPIDGQTFIYTVTDSLGNTETATVTVSVINSGAGADNLNGGAGPDILLGRRNRDLIIGGAGNDILVGGEDRDILLGGDGADIFSYESQDDGSGDFIATQMAIESEIDANEYDIVNDFTPGVDRIGLELDRITGISDILLTVQDENTVDDTTNILAPGQNLFAYESEGSTYLIYDENSNNTVGFNSNILVKLDGVAGLGTLSANDFVIS